MIIMLSSISRFLVILLIMIPVTGTISLGLTSWIQNENSKRNCQNIENLKWALIKHAANDRELILTSPYFKAHPDRMKLALANNLSFMRVISKTQHTCSGFIRDI